MKSSAFLPVALAVTLPAADSAAQSMSLSLSLMSEIQLTAGQAPENAAYLAFPFLTANDGLGDPVTQQVRVVSPFGSFEGFINHPNGWASSSSVVSDLADLEHELFNSGDWLLEDFTSLGGPPSPDAVMYNFSVSGDVGALDGLGGTLVTDNAHELDLGAPTFKWNNPGGIYDAVDVFLFDVTDPSQSASDLLPGDASSWSPTYTLVPGHQYQLFVNQSRDISGLVSITEPVPTGPGDDSVPLFPYSWGSSVFLSDKGIYDFTAVPEPHEYALAAGAALLGFGLWRRRRGVRG